jgi:hypothetical protein
MNTDYVHGYTEKEIIRLEDQAHCLNEILHHDSIFPGFWLTGSTCQGSIPCYLVGSIALIIFWFVFRCMDKFVSLSKIPIKAHLQSRWLTFDS